MMIFFLLALMAPFSWGTLNFSGQDAMNGISFKTYQNFPEKWPLVTIRFRKDTGEMRVTYANESAMKTLTSGSINYPDGAVIAKIGFHTHADSQFISSLVPGSVRRYQFMVKDKKKYASTGGWGYGLFDPTGKTFPEDPKATQDACFACHTIVENRGDVFSQPFVISKNAQMMLASSKDSGSKINYQMKKPKDLPVSILKFIPKEFKQIRFITNKELRKNLFQGTLDEMKPILEHEVRLSKLPALFASQDLKKFVLVIPTKTAECNDMGGFEIVSTDLNLKPIINKYCTHD